MTVARAILNVYLLDTAYNGDVHTVKAEFSLKTAKCGRKSSSALGPQFVTLTDAALRMYYLRTALNT
uniref:AlNc14C105G6171 protein n=1 Tax=Albugo laibachii Nc14 TaxID=890382 RepID=F0WHW5_9STRA|nr:AlNc14C105G6171 [Albugo laibachii Nc14]|eukprot:CCA20841.1 AlNc14C105G6171 [Albugo laibachii Nc14]